MENKLPAHYFFIGPDGIYSVTNHVDYIGTQSSLLEQLAKTVPRVIPGIFEDGRSLAITDMGMAIAGKLTPQEINIKTHFRPITDTKENVSLVPVWFPQKDPASQEAEMKWKAPADMILWLITAWECKNGSAAGHQPKVYFIAQDALNRRTYSLPMPNIHADGSVCMGEAFRPVGNPPGEQWNLAVKSLSSSTWNKDLIGGKQQTSMDLFRFDPNGKQVESTKEWRTLVSLVNHSNYAFVGGLT